MKTGDQVVQELPWKWPVHGKIFLLGGLGYMFDAWDVVIVAFLLPLLADDWGLSTLQLGLFGTTGLIGMAVGAFVWGTIADQIGRRRAFQYTLLIFSVFSLLGALAPSYEILLLTRFIAGIGLGGCVPVDYAMVAEFTPAKARGRVLAGLDVWWPIGGALCGLVSTLLLPLDSWRLLLAVMVIPALLVFWVRRSVPESPLYLMRVGREEKAREVIDGLVKSTGAQPQQWEMAPPEPVAPNNLRVFVSKFKDIWAFDWKITLTAWLVFVAVLLHYYGVLIWMPQILVEEGFAQYAAFLTATGMYLIGVVGAVGAALLVDVVGRKPVIIVNAVIGAIAMVAFTLVIDSQGWALAAILLYGLVIHVVVPAMYCYVPELYPTLLRASGFGWASTASRAVAGLVPLIFGAWLWPVVGLTNTFLIVGGFLVLAMLWLLIVGPETKGRELDEIQAKGDAEVPPGPEKTH